MVVTQSNQQPNDPNQLNFDRSQVAESMVLASSKRVTDTPILNPLRGSYKLSGSLNCVNRKNEMNRDKMNRDELNGGEMNKGELNNSLNFVNIWIPS